MAEIRNWWELYYSYPRCSAKVERPRIHKFCLKHFHLTEYQRLQEEVRE